VAADGYLSKKLVVSAEASRAIEVSLDPTPKARPASRNRGRRNKR